MISRRWVRAWDLESEECNDHQKTPIQQSHRSCVSDMSFRAAQSELQLLEFNISVQCNVFSDVL